jgi:hypothetical protein
MLRQERLKADYLKMRYEKGLDNYLPNQDIKPPTYDVMNGES